MDRKKAPHSYTTHPTTLGKLSAAKEWPRNGCIERIELDAAHLGSNFFKHLLEITNNETSQALDD